MEHNSVLHQSLVRRRGTPGAAAENSVEGQKQESDEGDYRAFSYGRVGLRPQMTLTLRFVGGSMRGLPYSQMLGIDSDDDDAGFRMEFPGTIVEVRGRNLKRLVRYVCDHRAAEIVESSAAASVGAPSTASIVDAIVLRRNLPKGRVDLEG
jgi:hypothetical protein